MPSRLAKPKTQAPAPSAEEIWRMIAEAAYYRAEKRGFTPGAEEEDWRDAEREVRQQLQPRI